MIDAQRATSFIKGRYKDLERVTDSVFRAFERHDGSTYAVRYFDLSDNLVATAGRLHEYQDELLGTRYFDSKASSDLRWNHYLYFITGRDQEERGDFARAKGLVESDREYARKLVISEDQINRVLQPFAEVAMVHKEPLPDLLSIWTKLLDEKGLGFALDYERQVPNIVRSILADQTRPKAAAPQVFNLSASERAASNLFLDTLNTKGFRKYPARRDFEFGTVNLITGPNGVGKTSFLEAIEYLYCGRLLREGRIPSDTEVTAELVGSNVKLVTTSATSNSQLRARHLAWYGQNELKTVTIQHSFGKFNFLNTDAAVELSIENSQDRIREDVVRLLLGPDAGKAFDRIERVTFELEATAHAIRKEIEQLRTRLDETNERLTALRTKPRTSDRFFLELRRALDQLGWIEPPSQKDRVDALHQPLSQAIAEVQLITRLGVAKIAFLNTAMASAEATFQGAAKKAARLVNLEIDATNKELESEGRVKSLQVRIDALNDLGAYISADFEPLLARKTAIEISIGELTRSLMNAPEVLSLQFSQETLEKYVDDAVSEKRARLSNLRNELADAERELDDFERSQAAFTSLQQQLRSIAQEVLSQMPDPDNCPLCRSKFEKGQLMERILSEVDDAKEETSDRLRKRVHETERLQISLGRELEELEAVSGFVEQLAPIRLSVAQAIERLQITRDQLNSRHMESRAIESRCAELQAAGLTGARLLELKTTAQIPGPLPSDQEARVLSRGLAQVHRRSLSA